MGCCIALELSPAAGYPTPGVGKVVRLNRTGDIEDVATGLSGAHRDDIRAGDGLSCMSPTGAQPRRGPQVRAHRDSVAEGISLCGEYPGG